MKSLYNERFSFHDPLSKTSACRKTRHRSKSEAKCVLPRHNETNHDIAHESATEIISDDTVHSDDKMMVEADSENYCLSHIESNDRDFVEYDQTDNPQSLEFDLMMATDEELTEFEEDDKDNELAIECINTPSYSLDDQQQLLYKEASLSTAASNVLMMKYAVKHKLSWEALADLLQLVKLHCPFPNNVPSTLFHFKKHFKDLEYPTKHHYFCSACLSEASENAKVCSNRECSCNLNESASLSSFIEVPVDLQLKSILERKYVHDQTVCISYALFHLCCIIHIMKLHKCFCFMIT